jgi:hypothetical protein
MCETIFEGAASGARLIEAQVRQYSYFCTSKASKMSSKAAGARLTEALISVYMCMLIY